MAAPAAAASGAPTGDDTAPDQPGEDQPGALPDDGDTGDQALPPGHPSVAPGTGATPGASMPPADSSVPDSSLPRGTIQVRVVDAAGKPMSGALVRLGVLRQSIAEGDKKTSKTAMTQDDGNARFPALPTGTAMSYSVSVPYGEATYAVAPFNLRTDMGETVIVHVYTVTNDIAQALIGMRGVVYVEPRDDVFQLEVMFRVFNIGKVTWVPKDLEIVLPQDWKAFSSQDAMDDVRVEADGDKGVKILGTFSPGQHDVTFRFQLPNPHDKTYTTTLNMPPHLAELRVITQSSPGMELHVEGFDPAQPGTNDQGDHVLFTSRQLKRGEPELKDVSITLSGIPTPGTGRWVAVVIALAFAAAGVGVVASRERFQRPELIHEDYARARDVLLDELVALEEARQKERIGPRTYESTRRSLLDALTRLEAAVPDAGPARKSHVKSTSSAARANRGSARRSRR